MATAVPELCHPAGRPPAKDAPSRRTRTRPRPGFGAPPTTDGAEAKLLLGTLLETGRGVAKDEAAAAECYRDALVMGKKEALTVLERLVARRPDLR